MRNILSSVFHFLKKETVLSVASVLAVISAFMIHPDKEYLSYIDSEIFVIFIIRDEYRRFYNHSSSMDNTSFYSAFMLAVP